jgi:N-acetyl-gamma-glutamyl-phosphate reductase
VTAKVFIDGEAGTTGLQIRQRLEKRRDLQVVSIDAERRKDPAARAELMNESDAVILCLPDDSAKEAVKLVTNAHTVIIDASTAHRVDPHWVYGFAEMADGHRVLIQRSKRISNPGCYPTGFVGLVAPHLVRSRVRARFAMSSLLSALTGGVLLCLADMLARTVMAPQELPVGVLTAVMGGAYLMWRLRSHSSHESEPS